ncbi:hypothetical protein [Leptospira sp. GIMC2001]|uniref:hypothetical protein n=1 Tax=Leptospira sp. GIMC2001 TaxID=1513297 RepID=UPI0023495229|nr:hypothetical protein [Leptospira sp. GIMC2001]WCL49498.1 hypothetical protein O4O04_19750 [Leptospira sp. GIMC2001]
MKTWILFLPFIFAYIFVFLGIYLVWGSDVPQTGVEWFKILGSSALYLVSGIVGFIIISLYTLYRLVRESILFDAIKKHWPIIIALIYPFLPNLPGPIDEVAVATIMSSLAGYFGWKTNSVKNKSTETIG